jgi:hypothetical protein
MRKQEFFFCFYVINGKHYNNSKRSVEINSVRAQMKYVQWSCIATEK